MGFMKREEKVRVWERRGDEEDEEDEAYLEVVVGEEAELQAIEVNGVQDYIHRVGRTARAGRSGVAISLVNQYELEWYIQIEKLIGKKLPEFPAQEEEVLLLLERVTEAKRISQMVVLFSNFLFLYYLRLAS
ncbi:DEAD-box ATP-dependent RNA helicase 10 [Vitis vinifera]|uniref:DEAD-box ATP-dependent RNA helicase 10 n=1 Tax=Vitis vinifera TaxID=29760 RepID=A0A438JRB6_VITVI|nr:DEAD-box ATP-dependent RNA helicase 10 [Vitis vinifera]